MATGGNGSDKDKSSAYLINLSDKDQLIQQYLKNNEAKNKQQKKPAPRGEDLVRELPHDVLQTLEIHLRPVTLANRKNWRNLGSENGVKAYEMDYMETQDSTVIKMLCHHPKFVRYTVAKLLDDLNNFERFDILACLKEEHNILTDK